MSKQPLDIVFPPSLLDALRRAVQEMADWTNDPEVRARLANRDPYMLRRVTRTVYDRDSGEHGALLECGHAVRQRQCWVGDRVRCTLCGAIRKERKHAESPG